MKYLMFMKHAETVGQTHPPKALMDAMGEFVGRMFASGVLKDTGGLKPTSQAYRIRSSGGKLQVIDGPFVETKEVVGGFALVETKSREEADAVAREFMELHRVHWPEFERESEVRPIEEMYPGSHAAPSRSPRADRRPSQWCASLAISSPLVCRL